jgi:hypothetical protein
VAGGVAIAALLATAGCAAGGGRPDPTEVVTQYLDAIAAGDADTARALDAAAVDSADSGGSVDAETLRTDAVLAEAERIENPTVDSAGSGDDSRRVSVSYDLAGQSVKTSLTVAWDADSGAWVLQDSLTEPLTVLAEVGPTAQKLVSFDVPGATVTQPEDQAEAIVSFLVYPAVYTVTADIDPQTLVDPSAGVTQQVGGDPAAQPSAIFPVTVLP